MDSKLYKSITECDARAVWPMVRNIVAAQLMGKKRKNTRYLFNYYRIYEKQVNVNFRCIKFSLRAFYICFKLLVLLLL